MIFQLSISGRDATLELKQEGETCRFRLDSQPEAVALVRQTEPAVYSVLLARRSYEARVEQLEGAFAVLIDGKRFIVEVRDPRRWLPKSRGRHGEGLQSLTAAMPGKVVRVLASLGDSVEAGQGILVVEAMKMQNEMKAARAGRVVSISAQEGATVSAGEILATIE